MPSPICFGYETSLRILRETRPCELAPARSAKPPACVPSNEEIRSAIERLERAYPDLKIEAPAHILVSSPSRYRTSDVRKPHSCTSALPRASLLRLDDNIMITSPVQSLVHLATRESADISLLELAWELCGSYQTKRTASHSAYNVRPLATTRTVRDFVSRNPSVAGARKVSRILRYLADRSASARETKFALTLGLPMARGGYGHGIACMNYEVATNPAARAISGRSSLRCDLCWPEAKIDVEYQSRESHEGEVCRIRDSRRTNALISMGWTVLNVTNDELDSLWTTDALAETLRRLRKMRSQVRVADHHARKLKLRRQLGLPIGYE